MKIIDFIKRIPDRYIFAPNNSSRSYCPDCSNDLKSDSKVCPECGSKRKSVHIQMHEPIYIGKRSPKKLRASFSYTLLHLIIYGVLIYSLFTFEPIFIPRVETLDWFFSTVTQAYIALIALLVAVITFRLQQNNTERSELGRRIHEQSFHFLGSKADGMTIDDAISYAKSLNVTDHPSSKSQAEKIKALVKRVGFLEQSNQTSRKNLQRTFWASVLAAILSLIFLISVDYLRYLSMESIALIIVLEAVFIATYYTWKLVKSLR